MTALFAPAPKETAFTTAANRRHSEFVHRLLEDALVFSPVPPIPGGNCLKNPCTMVEVDIREETERSMWRALADGALERTVVQQIMTDLGPDIHDQWFGCDRRVTSSEDLLDVQTATERLGMCAIRVARAVHESLLEQEPFQEFHIRLTARAKIALALGWEAIARLGRYPLPPMGMERIRQLSAEPMGPFHFVSASDRDAGFNYTLGIALSPEAQALGTINGSYGLDGELIVPGQAVAPIPPLLSLATRLFAAGIITSSNISEEQHSIPVREFPQPDNYTDLQPIRPGLNYPEPAKGDISVAVATVVRQLSRNHGRYDVDAVIDITGLVGNAIPQFVTAVLAHPEVMACLQHDRRKPRPERIGLFLNVQRSHGADRIQTIKTAVDAVQAAKLKYLAITDDVENAWLPGIHEYLDNEQVNDIGQYADQRGVLVIDARPIDAIYTASTALQRIQSVMTTLSVDILKLGMWLTLDAHSAETLWKSLLDNFIIAKRMCLMPIGIVEPWSGFLDNRSMYGQENDRKNAIALQNPFEKIKFMIGEARRLGMPSLLTDTRHKHHWVLLGAKKGDFPPHPREKGDTTSLLCWDEFMQCEHLARDAGIMLGQAGSIEATQLFTIYNELTYDAALDGKNPATAIWTAETERVLRNKYLTGTDRGLQAERSADVVPYLAVTNRIYESHAKLDGWLRFLVTRYGPEEKLGRIMEDRRNKLSGMKKAAMAAQDDLFSKFAKSAADGRPDVSDCEAEWIALKNAFAAYHKAVKGLYSETRTRVSHEWQRMHGGK